MVSHIRALVRSLFVHRRFAWEMSRRDLITRTKGSFLGLAWVGIMPLVQATMYILFVSLILRRGGQEGMFSYAIYVLSGQVTWSILTATLQAAPTLLRERAEIVKQVIYPVETIPLTSLMVGGLASVLTVIVLLAFAVPTGDIAWTVLLFPLPVLLLVLFLVGMSWFFMFAGILFKDLPNIISVLMGVMMLMSPVVMTEQIVGPRLWSILLWNPLAHMVIAVRDVFFGTFHPWSWLIFLGVAVISFLVGAAVVNRAKLLINEYI